MKDRMRSILTLFWGDITEACVAERLTRHLELWIWRSGVQASPVALLP